MLEMMLSLCGSYCCICCFLCNNAVNVYVCHMVMPSTAVHKVEPDCLTKLYSSLQCLLMTHRVIVN